MKRQFRFTKRALDALPPCPENSKAKEIEYSDQEVAGLTPTLFAAEVGDLETFKMLVEHPGNNRGDPELTLRESISLERFDALWVAIAYGRHSIVTYLTERQRRSE